MRRALLDVNVLIALLDSDHIDHEQAHKWLELNAEPGWASCPITENGFVRIISQPRYPSPTTVAEAIHLLRSARDGGNHEFWNCDLSLLDDGIVDRSRLHGPRQVTDAYLLALAVARDGHFVSFDQSLSVGAVRDAHRQHLTVL